MVYTVNDTKTKPNLVKKISTPKKTNIFTNFIFSPIKIEEKSTCPINSYSIITNNSSESGKGTFNNLQNELNDISSPNKNFLSKKTKFRIDFIDNEKKFQKSLKKNASIKFKKKKNNKFIFTRYEEDVNEGRWNPDEHMRFIEAISNFGNEWKEVQKFVGTRSSNQVRSHAQKFFLKLKAFKDPSLGIDFTTDNIRSLSDIINNIKEFERENKCINTLVLLSQKISERNFNNNNYLSIKKEDVVIKDNKIIINNNSLYEYNNNIHNRFIDLKENIKNCDKDNTYKIKKKIVKFCKRKINKNTKQNENKFKRKNENMSKDNKDEINEIKNETQKYNTTQNGTYYFDDDLNKINFIDDYSCDNLNDFEYQTNNNFYSFSNLNKESNTLSIMNKYYFC